MANNLPLAHEQETYRYGLDEIVEKLDNVLFRTASVLQYTEQYGSNLKLCAEGYLVLLQKT